LIEVLDAINEAGSSKERGKKTENQERVSLVMSFVMNSCIKEAVPLKLCISSCLVS
jgi:hypothetical protein